MSVQPALGKTPSKVSRLISCQPLEDRGITSPSQVSSGHGPAFGMGPHPSASGVKSADLVFQKAMWAMGPAERIPLPDWLLLANRSDQGPHRESRGASSPQKGLRERLSDRPSSQTHWPTAFPCSHTTCSMLTSSRRRRTSSWFGSGCSIRYLRWTAVTVVASGAMGSSRQIRSQRPSSGMGCSGTEEPQEDESEVPDCAETDWLRMMDKRAQQDAGQ